jgi:type I restriction enzyme S subunit
LLSSDFVQQQVWLSQDGSSREGLNFADFGCFAIIVPKIEEQQKVLKFLESKISEINMLIQKIESAITKLHEYRSSIITAAVTGKIDVRDGR